MAAQRFTAQLSFGNKDNFGHSFGNSFGSRIFSEQLCFSIDLAVSSLLLPMLPKNLQKVSGIENSMQTSLHRRSRPRRVLGPFFLVTAGILVTRGSMAFTALLKASRGSMAFTALSPDSSNMADSSNSFSNSFSNKFFLEQLCFSIDLAILPLLLLMLLRNPQKVSGIENSMQTSLHG